jgi:hypothetical protein
MTRIAPGPVQSRNTSSPSGIAPMIKLTLISKWSKILVEGSADCHQRCQRLYRR